MNSEIHDGPGQDILHELAAGEALPPQKMRRFAIVDRDPDDRLRGGISGEIAFSSAHASHLRITASQRNAGLGGRLLTAAEGHTQAFRCARVHLETRNPRTVRFYEKLGYRIFGKLPDYADGKNFHYFEKPWARQTLRCPYRRGKLDEKTVSRRPCRQPVAPRDTARRP